MRYNRQDATTPAPASNSTATLAPASNSTATPLGRRGMFRTVLLVLVSTTLVALVAVPMLLMLLFSFTSHTPTAFYTLPFTFSGYGDVFTSVFGSVLLSSVGMSLWVTVVTLAVGFPFALSLASLRLRTRLVVLILLILPFWVSTILKIFAFQVILSSNGMVNSMLLGLGVIVEPLQLLYTNFAAVLGMVYVLLPFMILPVYNSIRKIPQECYSAAHDLGASSVRTLFQITIPLSRSGIFGGILMVFPPSLTMFYVSDILGGSKTLLLGGFIRNQYTVAGNWGYGSAISVVFMIVLVSVPLFIGWLGWRGASFFSGGGVSESRGSRGSRGEVGASSLSSGGAF